MMRAILIYMFVGFFNIAQTACQHHQDGGNHDGRDGGDGDGVDGHGQHHEEHDDRSQGGFIVERHAAGGFEGFAKHHPGSALARKTGNGFPRALHEDDVGSMQADVANVTQEIIAMAAHAEDVDTVAGAEVELADGFPDHLGGGHQQDFGNADAIEGEIFALLLFLATQQGVFSGEEFHLVFRSGEKDGVAIGKFCISGSVLFHTLEQRGFLTAFATNFNDGDAVGVVEVEGLGRFSDDGRIGGYFQRGEAFVKLIFFGQLLQGFPFSLDIFSSVLREETARKGK